MNCQETRQRLSRLADNELQDEEVKAVRGHLAGCPSCRRDLDEQGALDMLLKSRYSTELRDSDLASLWPSVAERLDATPGEKPPNGGGAKVPNEGEIVFKSSSAMQMLNIPERRVETPYRAAGGEPVAPPPQTNAWRWPVAFVVGAALIAGGLIYMKQTTPSLGGTDQSARVASAPGTIGPSGSEGTGAATSQPTSQPSAVAIADPTEAGAAPAEPGASPEAKARIVGKAKRAAKGKGKEGEEPPAPAAKAKAEAKPEAAKVAKGGKKDDLDSLIDNVIGDDTPAKKKAAAAPKADPASDLSEQLDMNQIRNAINKVKGHVQSCYDQFQVEGMAKVTFTISPDGSVKDASIKGKFFGTDTGTCVVGAVKKARFPKFKGKPMTIPNYPFLLQ
jgi:hypothetical protein